CRLLAAFAIWPKVIALGFFVGGPMKIASLEIELMAGIARLQQDMRRAEGVVERSMRQIETQVQRVQRAFGALGIGLGLGATVRQVQQLADAWQGLENRLRLVTTSQRQ